MINVISQSLRLDLDNINVYAEVYQNIPLSSRDMAISAVYILFWSFEISDNILRNQK